MDSTIYKSGREIGFGEKSRRATRRQSGWLFGGVERLVGILDHCEDTPVKRALVELAERTMFMKILGSYPNVNR